MHYGFDLYKHCANKDRILILKCEFIHSSNTSKYFEMNGELNKDHIRNIL